jgi:hypothetical protein
MIRIKTINMIGLKSNIPTSGTTRRIGINMGSTIESTQRRTG